MNFHKYGNIGIIGLDFDITLKNKSGSSYDLVTTIYVIVYGVSGHQTMSIQAFVIESILSKIK